MYNNQDAANPPQPEMSRHLKVAREMSNAIINDFDINDQNEMLKAVWQDVKEERQRQLKMAEMNCEILSKSLAELDN